MFKYIVILNDELSINTSADFIVEKNDSCIHLNPYEAQRMHNVFGLIKQTGLLQARLWTIGKPQKWTTY